MRRRKHTIGIITILLLLVSLPAGAILGNLSLKLVDLTPVMQDVFILLSITICILASIIFYITFSKETKP
ncbi:hypothetical protein NYE70_23540 [Paenibacillus sp. FSL R5-0407]|uniref:Uncharacterized protein n=1 Tax=Paenibacillus vini TaxID=1476024 RepID=A0ABQ4MFT8_9BACL|nr:hypothetical protein J42TS3_33150 [Paenibacillus vini]